MRHPYYRVALTYWQNGRVARSLLVALLVPVIFAYWLFSREDGMGESMAVLVPFAFILVCFPSRQLGIHLRQHFLNSAAGLLPGYWRHHLLLAAVAGLLVVVGLPLWIAHLAGWSAASCICLSLLPCVLALWCGFATSDALMMVILLTFIWLCSTPSARDALQAWLAGGIEPTVHGLAVLAALLLLALFAILTRRQMSDWMPFGTDEGNGPSSGAPAKALANRQWSRWDAGLQPGERRFARLRSRPVRGAWARAWRWQLASGRPWLRYGEMLVPLGLFAYLGLWARSPGGLVGMLQFATLLLPIVCLFQTGRERQAALGCELLRPQTREQLLVAVGLTLARTQLLCWIALHLAALTAVALLTPDVFGPQYVIMLTALIGATQVMAFGLRTWLPTVPSWPTRWLAYILLWFPAVVINGLLSELESCPHTGLVVGVSVVVATIGLLLTLAAYRNWWEMDLGRDRSNDTGPSGYFRNRGSSRVDNWRRNMLRCYRLVLLTYGQRMAGSPLLLVAVTVITANYLCVVIAGGGPPALVWMTLLLVSGLGGAMAYAQS